jgi:hypothetical protein
VDAGGFTPAVALRAPPSPERGGICCVYAWQSFSARQVASAFDYFQRPLKGLPKLGSQLFSFGGFVL